MLSKSNLPKEELNHTSQAALTEQTPQQRVQLVDVLRAFALFGILFIHSVDEFLTNRSAEHLGLNTINSFLANSLEALIQDKFYIIFSFLFGWGFYVMHRSAKHKKEPFVVRYLWRLAILLAIGTLHSLLYWDILQIYAVVAPFLLFCRYFEKKQLLILSVLLFVAGTASFALREQLWATLVSLKEGGIPVPGKVVQYIVTGRFFMTAAMFALGLYAGKAKLFRNISAHLHLFRLLAMWSGGIAFITIAGLLLNKHFAASPAEKNTSVIASVLYSVQVISLGCFYVSGMVLLYCRAAFRRVLNWLAPLGKVSLTGYLTQSVFLQLFYNFGNGQALGLPTAMAVTLLFYVSQVLFAHIWLYRFKMGPIEWLWRIFTYLKWSNPIKKRKVSLSA